MYILQHFDLRIVSDKLTKKKQWRNLEIFKADFDLAVCKYSEVGLKRFLIFSILSPMLPRYIKATYS